ARRRPARGAVQPGARPQPVAPTRRVRRGRAGAGSAQRRAPGRRAGGHLPGRAGGRVHQPVGRAHRGRRRGHARLGVDGAGGGAAGVGGAERAGHVRAAPAAGAQRPAHAALPPAGAAAARHRAGRRVLGRVPHGAVGHLRRRLPAQLPARRPRRHHGAAHRQHRPDRHLRDQPGGVPRGAGLLPPAHDRAQAERPADRPRLRDARAGARARLSGGARPGAAPASTAAGYLLVALAAVLWALLGVFSKRLLAAGVSPTEIAFWRAALGGLAFACHAALTGGVRLARRRDAPAFGAFALVGVTLFYSALNLAIDAGGVSLAVILLYTAPAFVAVLAALLLGERLTRVKAGLVLLSVLGVALVARSGGGGVSVTGAAVTWGLVAGLSYSSYYLFGKWVLRRYRPAAIYALVMPIGAVGLLPWVPFDALSLATPGL